MRNKSCNVFPRVWAAIMGCEGRGPRRNVDGEIVHACGNCAATRRAANRLDGLRHQTFLREAQDLAGVENYRYQRSGRDKKTGRPYLVVGGAHRYMPPVTVRWTDFTRTAD